MYRVGSRAFVHNRGCVGPQLQTLSRCVCVQSSQMHKMQNRLNRIFNKREFASSVNLRQKSSVNLEPFLNGSSGAYVEEMYESWRKDPKSVHTVLIAVVFIGIMLFSWAFQLL